ncbi:MULTISPECIES: glutaminase A [Halomonadaceae]|uniref:glutaminase A n=1 Tax=Halomonadaceae TaxID=28256 RepID=UPI00159B12F2|nr:MULTISPECIES: glutaminase A [Halomonas]QJQ94889.1 glutaminase A [Halomonas sp. PA5]
MEQFDQKMKEHLKQVIDEELSVHHDGSMPSFMEEIGNSDQELVGIGMTGDGGAQAQAGGAEQIFPLESASKALSLALSLEDNGPEVLFRHVGREPSGDPYHSIATLEEGEMGIPSNPMINAGAIVVTSMIKGRDGDERFARLLDFVRTLADNPAIDYNHPMYEAEDKDLNRALFYFMRNHDVIEGSEEDKLVPYAKQTSIEMNCLDLSRIAAVFANQGRDPVSGEALISERTVRIVLTLMFTTGMYDESGRFAVEVGVPAKSGISGAIMAVVPGRLGVGLIGPALNASGNSLAGMRLLRNLSAQWQWGVF